MSYSAEWGVSVWEYNRAVHGIFIDFKTTYDSVKKKILYNILTETGTQTILVRY